ncbi:response regulator, partial [Oharaeibacter diazotrophicus]
MSRVLPYSDRSIVVVDDNRKFLAIVGAMLREFGFQWIHEFEDPREAFLFCTRAHVDCIVTDLVMRPVDGFQFADKVRHADVVVNRVVPIILATGAGERKLILSAISHGIDEVLVKPFSAVQLRERLVAVFERPRVYIKTPTGYFGPDRRRRNDPRYHGPERRVKNEAIVVDETMLKAMRAETRRKYGKVRPSPLEPEVVEPVLVGPITTIPVSVITDKNGKKTVVRVPTPMREEIAAAAAPAAVPPAPPAPPAVPAPAPAA